MIIFDGFYFLSRLSVVFLTLFFQLYYYLLLYLTYVICTRGDGKEMPALFLLSTCLISSWLIPTYLILLTLLTTAYTLCLHGLHGIRGLYLFSTPLFNINKRLRVFDRWVWHCIVAVYLNLLGLFFPIQNGNSFLLAPVYDLLTIPVANNRIHRYTYLSSISFRFFLHATFYTAIFKSELKDGSGDQGRGIGKANPNRNSIFKIEQVFINFFFKFFEHTFSFFAYKKVHLTIVLKNYRDFS